MPQRENNLLNAVLFDIINCEQDLVSHCKVEDTLLVPAVRELEARMAENLSMVDDTVATNGSVSADMLSNREKR